MRLFLDSNTMTYVAFFEGYLCEGSREEFDVAIEHWHHTQSSYPDRKMLHEVEALRTLYLIDDQAHFDWLFSEIGMDEVRRIRDTAKRSAHHHLLDRLIEHRRDIYVEEHRNIDQSDREALVSRLFPTIPEKMRSDALQYCEAVLVESDCILTNDHRFIKRAREATGRVKASTVSNLPFVARAKIA